MSKPQTLLIRNADIVVTMDGTRCEIANGAILVRDGVIVEVGDSATMHTADKVIDATGKIITPGLINTHHHLFQSLTRAVPNAQDALLFGWLQTLYPIWARMTPEDIYLSAYIGLAEMALTGCTLSSDHLYIFPNGSKLDDSIAAATDIGIRFHATRGSMSIGESDGGLPPDHLVETESAILDDSIRVIDKFHQAGPGAMVEVGVAPCSPFSVSQELMRDSAILARDKGVMMHTHLAENEEDIAYSLEKFGLRPGDYAKELGWVGKDVWHAHCVMLNQDEIDLFARTGTGIAHCPCSNMRLGSGIAPIGTLRAAGINVGLGVDGSASNDSGHLLNEARQAMLLQRVKYGATAMKARDALEIATLGGAAVLGRDDLGSIEVGKRADFALFDCTSVEMSGAFDPVAGLIFCGPLKASDTFVEGKQIVRDGQLVHGDFAKNLGAHTKTAHRLAQ